MPAKTTIQLRRDSAADWTSTNPALAEGEIGVETDTGKFKIGKEVSGSAVAWNSLAYANPPALVTAVTGGSTTPLSESSGTLSLQGGFARYTGSTDTHVSYPKVTVKSGSTGPASPSVGDVWIKF
jgi:hypothetical protein